MVHKRKRDRTNADRDQERTVDARLRRADTRLQRITSAFNLPTDVASSNQTRETANSSAVSTRHGNNVSGTDTYENTDKQVDQATTTLPDTVQA